jgi:hypothetical protein
MSVISTRGAGQIALIAVFVTSLLGELYTPSPLKAKIVVGIIASLSAAYYGFKENKAALDNGAVEAPHQLVDMRMEYIFGILALAASIWFLILTFK